MLIATIVAITKMPRAIGIDLGTVYSCVGVSINGNVEIIPEYQGHRVIPSVVAYTNESQLVGNPAKNQIGLQPTSTIYGKSKF